VVLNARSARAGSVQRNLSAWGLTWATHQELVPHPRETRLRILSMHVRVLDQVQLAAPVLPDGVPVACRQLRIGPEHVLNLVIEGMPYRIGRHGRSSCGRPSASAAQDGKKRKDADLGLERPVPLECQSIRTDPGVADDRDGQP
jgi:hypothetical protein